MENKCPKCGQVGSLYAEYTGHRRDTGWVIHLYCVECWTGFKVQNLGHGTLVEMPEDDE